MHNYDYSERDLMEAAVFLKTKGLSDGQTKSILQMMTTKPAGNEMSSNDGVYIEQSEPDAPGVFISADQKLQDAYASSPQAQRQMSSGMQGVPQYFAGTADLNIPVQVQTTNPNYRVETEGQRRTVDQNGNVVIY
jgi:hypothetical protein